MLKKRKRKKKGERGRNGLPLDVGARGKWLFK